MLKSVMLSLLLLSMVSVVALAGNDNKGRKAISKVKTVTIDPETVTPSKVKSAPSVLGAAVLITTMPNQFGTGTNQVTNMSYDEATNVLVFGHRGPTVSGQASYTVSADGGNTWDITVGPLGAANNARYPSVVLINPTGSTDIANLKAFMAFPVTPDAVWGYGADTAFGSNAGPRGTISNVAYDFTQRTSTLTVDDLTGTVFVTGNELATGDVWVSRSTDFGGNWTNTVAIPNNEYLRDAVGDVADIIVGTDFIGGRYHLGMFARYAGADTNSYKLGWKFSTNGGATFSTVETVGIAGVQDLATKVQQFNQIFFLGGVGQTQGGFVVDANGDPHFVVGLTDTVRAAGATNNTGVYEIYKQGGTWKYALLAKFRRQQSATDVDGGMVRFPNASVTIATGGLGDVKAARTKDGTKIGAKWVDLPSTLAVTDSIADIFVAGRGIGGVWSAAKNITNSTQNEKQTHLANRLKFTSTGTNTGNLTFFTNWTEFVDATAAPNAPAYSVRDSVALEVQNISSAPIGVSVTAKEFRLAQNYPNPFNPTTNIDYSLKTASDVTLKVYDVLGREVETLFSGRQTTGTYRYNFDASRLSSGVYFYRLQAGEFVETKKMMLVK